LFGFNPASAGAVIAISSITFALNFFTLWNTGGHVGHYAGSLSKLGHMYVMRDQQRLVTVGL